MTEKLRFRRTIAAALSLAVVILSAASCGLRDGSPPQDIETPTLPPPAVTSIAAPDPNAAVEAFLSAWQAQDYAAMYALLTSSAQASISLEDFTARYTEIETGAALNEISFELLNDITHPRNAQVSLKLALTSAAAGLIERELALNLVREGEGWRIMWSDAAILPELAPELGVFLDLNTPPRGTIFDRNGTPMASPEQVVALWIVPNQVGGEDAESSMLSALGRLFGRRPEAIQALYDDIRAFDWRVPLGEVSISQFQAVEGTLAAVGGVQWGSYGGRFYPDNGLAAHAVGYVAQLQQEQLEDFLRRGYPRDAFVGQIGLERAYEAQLHGDPGGTLYLLNADGQVSTSLGSETSGPRTNLYTTLDAQLQIQVEQAISGFAGAVVVLERDSGAVLAMASSPDFDPNLFDWRNPNSGDGLTALFSSQQTPLINRATTGTYPLGSVFKIITMAAALESGFYEPGTIYDCGHEFRELPGRTLFDWTLEKELPPQGEISLVQALERSCNPYFFHIGLDLFRQGLTTSLTDMARQFGLGQDTGIEIDEDPGLIPGPETQALLSDGVWSEEDSVDLAIGQSILEVTPLQVARFVAAVGNGGVLYRPQLVSRIETETGQVVSEFAPDAQAELGISSDTLAAIQEAMVRVVRQPKGTAENRFRGLNLRIAGKTGTAQTSDFTDPHAWFAGYTFESRENRPDIAVVVIVEFQGEGSEWAAPIFRRVVESYFFGRPIAVYPWESQIGVLREPTPTPGPEDEVGDEEPTPTP